LAELGMDLISETIPYCGIAATAVATYVAYLIFCKKAAVYPIDVVDKLFHIASKNSTGHQFAVITGSTSGIGEQIAKELYRVIIVLYLIVTL